MEVRSKQYYAERSSREMAQNLDGINYTIQQQLTITARKMAMDGHESGVAGQISAKAEEAGTFWTLRFGIGFDEATPDTFLRVDGDLNTVEGKGVANPATRFHLWVYNARPEIKAMVHAHPPWISALSCLEQPLIVAHMDQTPFLNDCAFLAEWPGLPFADDEGQIISDAIGDKTSILLAHHGYLTTGRTVAEACFLGIYLERAARMQMRAAAAGIVKPVDVELAKSSHEFFKSSTVLDTTFEYYGRQVATHYGPDCLIHN